MAAQSINATGRLMRSLCRAERDPAFAARYEEALEDGKRFYPQRLEAESRARALAGSDRMLEVELATHHPDYAHLRRDRFQVNGKIDHEHAFVIKLDPAILDQWPEEQLDAALATLDALASGGVVDGEFRELGPGE